MRRALAGVVFGLALALAGCSPAGQGGRSGPGGTVDGGASGTAGTVTVFAAASLKTAFTDIAGKFEAANPGTGVALSFAGSADLVTQITQGAPADVFASADTRNMDKLKAQDLVAGQPGNFATNTLTIVVPPGNPARITGFGDLARSGVKVVACAGQVPCGAATKAIEQETGTTLTPVSEESSVTDVLGKVTSGEADAGLVYVTDARSAGSKVEEVRFPEAAKAINTYPLAAVKGARNKPAADAFVQFVLGPEGQAALAAAGFGKP
ncbi:molybdate ABC transporter substrate-binding protein [Pseudarthrobacter sp. TAF60_1]|uniref:molybdate ABC transporter substrate-binding protein n=1 Tax=Pseudarthrobacter sp. TAF60_1 TaxID=3233071 RepID=UPI003F964C6E